MDVIDDFRLDGKSAIVTGGSKGIGKAIATALADVGASVVVANRTAETGETAAAEIRKETDGTVVAIPADVTDESSVERLVEETVDEFGGLDVLVNNAGIAVGEPATEKPRESWDRTIETNLTGVFLCSKHGARAMMDDGGGSIVTISSINAFVAEEHVPHVDYHASKGGVEAMTRQLALEWGNDDIRVNTLAPGYIQTELSSDDTEVNETRRSRIPLGKLGSPDDLVGAAVFLASDASAYVSGSTLLVDGGYTAR